jgi:RNA polymerase sigma-70 factor (ECF subfamily)
MSEHDVKDVRELVDAVYRSESRQVLATLIRLLGDFETAEEALHDAFAVAVEQWARDGMPANPRAGSSRPAASRPSTGYAGAPGSTHR